MALDLNLGGSGGLVTIDTSSSGVGVSVGGGGDSSPAASVGVGQGSSPNDNLVSADLNLGGSGDSGSSGGNLLGGGGSGGSSGGGLLGGSGGSGGSDGGLLGTGLLANNGGSGGSSGGGILGTGLGSNANGGLLGTGINTNLDLFGDGGLGVNLGVGVGTGGITPCLINCGGGNPNGPTNIYITLFGGNGGNGGGGGSGSGGGNTQLASLAPMGGKCFTPNNQQISHLVQSRDYSNAASFRRAGQVQVIPVNLCKTARAKINNILANDGNVAMLRSALSSHRGVMNAVGGDVGSILAAQKNGSTLTVYVY
jgi:hypothetical protein